MGRAGNPEKSMLAELALTSMDELVKMAQASEPLWIPSFEGRSETLNYEEYLQVFPRCIGPRALGYLSKVTREKGNVIINSLALVKTLMDAVSWLNLIFTLLNCPIMLHLKSYFVG
ncbi:hypothetical protein AMTRI_Chr08g165250 [Amborella trichopoda]|uniref:START domain-containing protein n=1 Tax=Amborella trichopoda TaxID=13333 RepID=W1NJP6_AMBTC|nr:hypothetical protein AMTR_s00023p00236220 [Amborella trichopoda]